MNDWNVVLVDELFAGENHRNADRGHQTDESELDPPLRFRHVVVIEKVVPCDCAQHLATMP